MINHVVLFKLKDYPAEEKQQIIQELKASLLELKEKISELKYIEVGEHFQPESANYDLALISHFESPEALEAYRVHPEHQKVVARIAETTVARAAVDYRF